MSRSSAIIAKLHKPKSADHALEAAEAAKLEAAIKVRKTIQHCHDRFMAQRHGTIPFSNSLKKVEKSGVIYVTDRAAALGYTSGHPEWTNLGQGAPEVGPIPWAPPRAEAIILDLPHEEYAPVNGLESLRSAVANYYNTLYRQGMSSQYTSSNVCIVPGGRAGLTRLMSVLGTCSVGYFLPDWTAYAETLGMYASVSPQPLLRDDETVPYMPPSELRRKVYGMGLEALLMSNPCNPTGAVIRGAELEDYVRISRESSCLFILDEIYSHYIYDEPVEEGFPSTHSAARFVEDVNRDPIVITSGLTKCWRLPGWRVCWVVGPEVIIESLAAAGSYLDGGANNPLQLHALPYLDTHFLAQDIAALQQHFRTKRDWFVKELQALGIMVQSPPATFYVWANLSNLPEPLNDGVSFFEHCLEFKVIVVPGIFFDLSPRGLRANRQLSPCAQYVRLSFGPEMEQLKKGIEGIRRLVEMVR